jgi:ribonuclease BN (tRNA processing enzyme)
MRSTGPKMELIILGSGTSVPSLKRGSSGYLVRSGATLVLLDSGPGTLQRILLAGHQLEEITHIYFSHTHVDHTADLAPLLFTSRNPGSPRRAPLTIGGSRGFLDFFGRLSALYGRWIEAATFPLDLVELTAGPRPAGSLDVSACPVPHIPSSVAIRLGGAGGRSMVYSGDTGESAALADFSRATDLLLLECSFPEDLAVEGHLTPSSAGRIASAAAPGRLVLTHFYPACEGRDLLAELRSTYHGEAVLAEDGMRIRI